MFAYGQRDKKLTAFMNPAGRHTIFSTSQKATASGHSKSYRRQTGRCGHTGQHPASDGQQHDKQAKSIPFGNKSTLPAYLPP